MAKKSPEELAKENETLKAQLATAQQLLKDQEKTPEAKLPADVAKQYELVDWVGGARQIFGPFGIVDLSKMTLQKAAQLVKGGFTKLKSK